MRSFIFSLCNLFFLLVITSPFFLSNQVQAQEFSPAVIGILDMQRIKKESKAIISIRKQITEIRKIYKEEFSSEEAVLREEEQELARQRTVLSQEAFKRRNLEFRDKVQKLQRRMQNASQKLQRAEAIAVNKFNKELGPILAAASKAHGVTVVLFASQVAFAPRSLDLTLDIMERLNTVLPEILVIISEQGS